MMTTTAAWGQGEDFFLKKKNAFSPFFDASGNKNIGDTIRIVERFGVSRMRDFFFNSTSKDYVELIWYRSPDNSSERWLILPSS